MQNISQRVRYVTVFSKVFRFIWPPEGLYPSNVMRFHISMGDEQGQSDTQRSMGRGAPRNPPQYPGS